MNTSDQLALALAQGKSKTIIKNLQDKLAQEYADNEAAKQGTRGRVLKAEYDEKAKIAKEIADAQAVYDKRFPDFKAYCEEMLSLAKRLHEGLSPATRVPLLEELDPAMHILANNGLRTDGCEDIARELGRVVWELDDKRLTSMAVNHMAHSKAQVEKSHNRRISDAMEKAQ